ncbi:MAG: hypothetical protein A3D95_01890 [Betaproteobacteria bacterium RIFCSPHIGHO2_12_FULL_69_13]|nr:MAG: hypothetical protein A3D95_01890 [Betaproteobacteria bacterium RIFCSPHIGHO2_12_FULL_69_13]OGA69809.1 MAG: hypothetical protein A3G83_16545 [Betaproteobacteria bacterium RIFCSPLOWO2_12_FULL_68_20]
MATIGDLISITKIASWVWSYIGAHAPMHVTRRSLVLRSVFILQFCLTMSIGLSPTGERPLGFEDDLLMDATTSSLCLQAQEIMFDAYGERFRSRRLLKQRVQAGLVGGRDRPGWRRQPGSAR